MIRSWSIYLKIEKIKRSKIKRLNSQTWIGWSNFCCALLLLDPISKIYCLKGTVWRDFQHIFWIKKLVCVFTKIFANNVCQRSQPLCFADTMSAWSTTTWTSCQPSQRLRKHCVSVVNDYADTCHHSQRLHGHRIRVVINYADTQEIILLWKK